MITRRLAVPLLLALPAILNGARPELSVALRDPSGRPQEITIRGSSPGMRLQFVDGVHPIGVVVVDRSGGGHLTLGSLPSGRHAVRAVEWGTGRSVTKPLHFTIPARPANSLAPGASYATGIRPIFVTSGDLDGEGYPSVILGGADGVSLMRNTGGVFSSPVKLLAISEPTAVVVQDFNGDGLNDLAITSADGRVAILLNRGGGEFAPARYFAAGARPSAIVSADFNGDGVPDLAIANQEGNDISVLLGSGDGSFQPAAAVPAGSSPRSLVVADFNGDGLPDLATANFAGNNVSILMGNGKGGFRNGGVFASGNGPVSLVTADFDEDGTPDLAVLNQLDGSVVVLLNDGPGVFHAGRWITNASSPDSSSLAAGDVDGDGHCDLVLLSGAELRVRIGRGDGSFGDGYSTLAGRSPLAIGLDDFSRDGRLAAVVIDLSGTIAVLSRAKATPRHGTVAGESTVSPSLLTPQAQNVLMTFDQLQNGEPVGSYYAGGLGGNGTGPGPNYGVVFASSTAQACNVNILCTNVALEPSSPNVLQIAVESADFTSAHLSPSASAPPESTIVMNVSAGLTSLSFYYSAPFYTGSVAVYDSANATGNMLASLTLPLTGQNCDASAAQYSCWDFLTVPFSGVAKSVSFGGYTGTNDDYIVFDNISVTVGGSSSLTITTTSLPNGTVDFPYSQTLTAANGTKPYTWTATGAPPGLTVTTSGVVTGTPTTAGSYELAVTVTDSSNPKLTDTLYLPITILQLSCTYTLTPSSVAVGQGASTGNTVAVTATSSCPAWTASSNATSWLNVTSANGTSPQTGNGTVVYSVAANTDSGVRYGDLTIGPSASSPFSATFAVNQAGQACQITGLTPASASLGSAASPSNSFVVSLTPANCNLSTPTNYPSWVTLPNPSVSYPPVISGNTATVTVSYSVPQRNSTGVAQSGAIDVTTTDGLAQAVFAINQAATTAPPCNYALSQTGQSFTSAGNGGSVAVTASAGCPLTANSSASWLTPSVSNGTVSYTFPSNPNTTARAGLLTIQGQNYLVTQLGSSSSSSLVSCAVSLPNGAPQVEVEGRTEILGSLVLNCTGFTGTITAADIALTLNTNVTNAVVNGTNTSDATLTIGAATTPGQVLSYNTLHWPGVTLTPGTPMTIGNVRADASMLGSGAAITSQVSVSSTVPVTVTNATPTLANTATTLAFVPGTPYPPPGNFAGMALPVSFQNVSPPAFQPGSGNTQPTRFRVVLTNVPSDVNLYAGVYPTGGTQAQLYTAGADCGAGLPGYLVTGSQYGGVSYYPLLVNSNGTAAASWVVLSGNPTMLTFPLMVTPTGTGTDYQTAWSTIKVVGTYAPVSPPETALCGNTDPAATTVPRYRDFSVPLQFSYLQVTPTVTLSAAGLVTISGTVTNTGGQPWTGNVNFAVLGNNGGTGGAQLICPPTDTACSSSNGQISFTRTLAVGQSLPLAATAQFAAAPAGQSLPLAATAQSAATPPPVVTVPNGFNSNGSPPPGPNPSPNPPPPGPQPPTPTPTPVVPQSPSLSFYSTFPQTVVAGATIPVNGEATSAALNIASVTVTVNGVNGSPFNAAIDQPDTHNFCTTNNSTSPDCPNVDFSYSLNTTGWSPGSYQLTATAADALNSTPTPNQQITVLPATYAVSGLVDYAVGGAMQNVTMTVTSSTGSPLPTPNPIQTGAAGNYLFNMTTLGTYTVTPTLSGYSFSPPSMTFPNLSGNQGQNFTGTPTQTQNYYTVSGTVQTAGGALIPNVTIAANGAAVATTNTSGTYSVVNTLVVGNTYTLTASLSGYSFTPATITVSSATQTANFTGTPPVTNGTALDFYPVTPCRIADTRTGAGFTGQFGPPTMGSGATRTFNILSSPCAAGIPSTVAAYSLNLTVIPPSGGQEANLTTWPTGLTSGMPNVSTLNYYGSVVANAAIVPAGTNGAINVYVVDTTDVLIDINGYFAPPLSSGLEFYPVTPCRIADTRTGAGFSGQFGPPSLGAGATRTFTISNACGIPSTASAYSLNFTVVPPAGGPEANLTAWPSSQGPNVPNVSTLNYYSSVVANAALVPAGANDAINVYVADPTNVLFDTNGYFAPAQASGLHFYPLPPCRIADTRTGAGFSGQFGPPTMGAGTTRTFTLPASSCGAPATASAYSLNFTVVPPSGGPEANLTTWPTGLASGMPNVSTLNYYGSVVANAAIVPAGTNGAINVYVVDPTDVLIDINGYFAP